MELMFAIVILRAVHQGVVAIERLKVLSLP